MYSTGPGAELAVDRDREKRAVRVAVDPEHGHDIGRKQNGRISAPVSEWLPLRSTDTFVSFLAFKRVVSTDTSLSPYT